jgi:glucosyl-3-phosphoglycerate synthase
MSDFSQNRLKMTTFHILDQDRRHLRNQLRLRSKWKKTVIIIPLLASEYTDTENLPVFENILRQLGKSAICPPSSSASTGPTKGKPSCFGT